ncbi:MAG: hypothetical protein D4R68_07075 [Ignavibacteriales bacterium]|nr:MAG: hypothetical protein D4R68_07075 [Ignavibacteriales bacterium]
MRRNISFLTVIIILIASLSLSAQTQNISFEILQDLSSLDPGAFLITNNVSGQPRIFHVTITTNRSKIIIEGRVDWKQSLSSSYKQLLTFKTFSFTPRSFFNDELGSADIKIDQVNGDKDLGTDLVTRGKPTGVLRIVLRMLDDRGNFLADNSNSNNEILFLNPTAPSLFLPKDVPFEVTVGNAQISWSDVQGVLRYKVKACIRSENQSLLEALQSSDPVVDADVGNLLSINLAQYKRRELLEGQRIAVIVSAIVSQSGRETELVSEPRELKIIGSSSDATRNVSAEMLRLATFLSKLNVNSGFIDKVSTGQITLEQLQFFDENNQPILLRDFMTILSLLESQPDLVISAIFTAK